MEMDGDMEFFGVRGSLKKFCWKRISNAGIQAVVLLLFSLVLNFITSHLFLFVSLQFGVEYLAFASKIFWPKLSVTSYPSWYYFLPLGFKYFVHSGLAFLSLIFTLKVWRFYWKEVTQDTQRRSFMAHVCFYWLIGFILFNQVPLSLTYLEY